MTVAASRKACIVCSIFHITHLSNLLSVVRDGYIWSDSQRVGRSLDTTRIGYQHIKERRLRRPVELAGRGKLGDYVPFYFCPRSVMLYVISRGDKVAGYDGGQEDIIHLVSTVQAAIQTDQPWAFTNLHAELAEADYFDDLKNLDLLRWPIINSNNWGGDDRRKYKQAEFLVYQCFPWTSIEQIGVYDDSVADKVSRVLTSSKHQPNVTIEQGWYY